MIPQKVNYIYLDFNSQYEWALHEPVPYGGFILAKNLWISNAVFTVNFDRNSNFWLLIVANVDYPEYLQLS